MSVLEDQLHKDLSDAVLEMEEERAVAISTTVVRNKMDALKAIENGLCDGMNRAGKLYEKEEYFIPELLLCADAMYAGMAILRPHLRICGDKVKQKVVIGVVRGDTHDIGKNLVKIMFETSGFEVIDLGRDVPPIDFVEKTKETGARIIALSTLMTTTMKEMGEVIDILIKDGLRDKIKVMVGGGPVSHGFARRIGADGYAANASEAARLVRELARGLKDG